MHAHDHNDGSHQTRHSSRGKWLLIGCLAVAAYFLWSEHRADLMGTLPYLLFLVCLLMHFFHHHGHGGHHGDHRHSVEGEQRKLQNRDGGTS